MNDGRCILREAMRKGTTDLDGKADPAACARVAIHADHHVRGGRALHSSVLDVYPAIANGSNLQRCSLVNAHSRTHRATDRVATWACSDQQRPHLAKGHCLDVHMVGLTLWALIADHNNNGLASSVACTSSLHHSSFSSLWPKVHHELHASCQPLGIR